MDFRSYLDYLTREFGPGYSAPGGRGRADGRPGDPDLRDRALGEALARGGVLRIRSRVLGDDLWLISDERKRALVPRPEAAYLPEEIEVLRRLSPENARRIHRIKTELDGFIRWLGDKGPSKN